MTNTDYGDALFLSQHREWKQEQEYFEPTKTGSAIKRLKGDDSMTDELKKALDAIDKIKPEKLIEDKPKDELREKIETIIKSNCLGVTDGELKGASGNIISLIDLHFPQLAKERNWPTPGDIAKLKNEVWALHHERQGSVWYWQGDGEDLP